MKDLEDVIRQAITEAREVNSEVPWITDREAEALAHDIAWSIAEQVGTKIASLHQAASKLVRKRSK